MFIAEGEEFPAHRAIVCARCAYFATLFTTDLAEGAEDDEGVVQVEVPDPAPVFQRLLVFLYTGCSAATTNQVSSLLPTALCLCVLNMPWQEILQDLVCADRYGAPRLKGANSSIDGSLNPLVSSFGFSQPYLKVWFPSLRTQCRQHWSLLTWSQHPG